MININVRHVAKLANLPVSLKEEKLFSKQFKQILGYIEKLNQIDTSKVSPTYQTLNGQTNIWRQDKIEKSLTQKQALSQTSKTHKGYFLVNDVFSTKKTTQKPNIKPRRRIDKLNAILTKVNPNGTVGHKDLFCTKNIETTAGSNLLSGYKPQYSATVVKLLEESGLVTKYKLNQDAWGHGSSGENSDFGPTQNPWDTTTVPGGSSSGSGAALASNKIDLATGTDTCGSIRMPSCYCNLTGIKPTYGAVSRYGVIAFASSLDCPGLMARSAKELKKAFDLINKEDKKDATTQIEKRNKTKLKPIKTIGIPKEFLSGGIDKSIKEKILNATKTLKENGYKVTNISLPHAEYGIATYYIIAPTETSSNLARYDGVRFGNPRSYFGPEAKRRIMLGSFVSSAGYSAKYYEKAARVRTLIIKDFKKAYSQVDAILAPVSPISPFKIGEKVSDPLQLYLMDIFTAPASLSGLPSISLPCGFVNNLPIGMQLIGPRWSEANLFNLAKTYQKLTNWHLKNPKL
ncbi:MAG: Asp-tRNA(Asn)/Glu-tRNA(Gln) amidotransferase subunit GatC [Patescibacteria group bacterium]|nr:Asp-tRNA(Asn)/Glu-tRNA(Gln) amidotransferase subunit GatC [Patescibacteria group bacterium]